MSSESDNVQVVLGVTGSIAAYKAVELLRLMVRRGWTVHVIMTKAATQFVGPLTFQTLSQNPVTVDMFEEPEDWMPGHISLAQRADVMVVAPCTANVLAKMAHGLADDMLSCSLLATAAPIIVAPAMNEGMWEHPATQANMALLRERGVCDVGVGEGDLACGIEGKGRMAEPALIIDVVESTVKRVRDE